MANSYDEVGKPGRLALDGANVDRPPIRSGLVKLVDRSHPKGRMRQRIATTPSRGGRHLHLEAAGWRSRTTEVFDLTVNRCWAPPTSYWIGVARWRDIVIHLFVRGGKPGQITE